MRGTPRGDFTKLFKHTGNITAPKPSLSQNDNRSVNPLSLGRHVLDKSTFDSDRRNKESQAAPKVFRPNNYNQGLALASPEDFLKQSWPGKPATNAFRGDKKENMAPNESPDQAGKPRAILDSTSGTEFRGIPDSAMPSIMSTYARQPSEGVAIGTPIDNSNDIAHSTPVQVENEIGGKLVMIGSGSVCIKTIDQNPNIAKIIQIQVLGKTFLEESLLGSFEFKLDLCTISFYSGFEANRIKWVLTASQPGIAASLAEVLDSLKLQSIKIGSVGVPVEGHANKTATLEEGESLISFSDEGPTTLQAASQFTEDLFSLMGTQFIEDAVNAINIKIGQNYVTAAVPEVPGTRETEATQPLQKTFCGLAISRFANQVDVGGFLNRSAIFQKLPDSTAAFIKEQVSKGVVEEAQKDGCDQEVFEPVKQQSRRQYSIEALISLRNQPSSAKKLSGLDPCVEYAPKGEPCHLFNFAELDRVAFESPSLLISDNVTLSNSRTTRLVVPIVSGRETPHMLPGLTASKYASPQVAVAVQGPTKSMEQEPSVWKPIQECPFPKKPGPRAMKPIQGLSTSKYASPTAQTLSRGHLDTRKPGPSSVELIQDLPGSNDRPNYAVKEFKLFLNSKETKPPGPKPTHGLPVSSLTGTTLLKPLLELSASTNSKAASSEPLQGLSNQHLREPHFRKPFLGLASSKYASPLAIKYSATKTSLSGQVQAGPESPNFVAKSSIMKAVVHDPKDKKRALTEIVAQADAVRPSIFSMNMDSKESKKHGSMVLDPKVLTEIDGNGAPPSPKSGCWNTLRRRDSFNSHASRDSNETIKSLVPKPTMKIAQNIEALIQPSRTASGNQSILSMDSSASCESFATAIEETSTAAEAIGEKIQVPVDGTKSSSFQARTSDFVLFPDDVAISEAVGKESGAKSQYSSDMSELMGNSFAATVQPGPSAAKLASSFKPFSFPTMLPRKPVAKAYGGLLTSRYAIPAENITPGAIKSEPQHSSATVLNEAKKGLAVEKLVPKPPIHELEPNTHPRTLKPTASQFTPSVSMNLATLVRNPPPPALNTFSPPVQPVMATVFVPDPQYPGMLREVSGLLKMGSTPIVGYVATLNSPMGENFALGGILGNMVPSQRAPLTPIVQKSKKIMDKQQEIQERLTKSLTDRRFS
jgi:hypothetical protein